MGRVRGVVGGGEDVQRRRAVMRCRAVRSASAPNVQRCLKPSSFISRTVQVFAIGTEQVRPPVHQTRRTSRAKVG